MRLSPARAERFGALILVAAGVPGPIAERVAAHLVSSDAAGHASHGLGLLPTYFADLLAGRVQPASSGTWVQETGHILVIDGGLGFGAAVAVPALRHAAATARRDGIALLAVRNVHHLGRLGAFAEQAAADGLTSIHFCNVIGRPPVVVPAGGSSARFVTNPIAIGVPRPGLYPVVLDIATSGIAYNKARVAHLRGEAVGPGLLVDSAGLPTQDPGVLFREPPGALLPFAAHKGSGLATLAELLAGAVTGGRTIATSHAAGGATLNNMLSILIDPSRTGGEGWADEAEAMIAYLHDCPSLDPARPVMIPGQPEAEAQSRAAAEGLRYDPANWATLLELAAQHGVAAPVEEPAPS